MTIAVDAEEQEALALLVVAVVGVQHLADLAHHVGRLHGGGGLHAPREAQRAGLAVLCVLLGLPGNVATVWGKGGVERQKRVLERAEGLCVLSAYVVNCGNCCFWDVEYSV